MNVTCKYLICSNTLSYAKALLDVLAYEKRNLRAAYSERMQRMLNVQRMYSAYAQLTRSALVSTRAPRERQGKTSLFVKKQAMTSSPLLIALLRSSHCVLLRFYEVLVGDSKRLHDLKIFTVLVLRFWCVHCVSTAFAPRFHGVLALH